MRGDGIARRRKREVPEDDDSNPDSTWRPAGMKKKKNKISKNCLALEEKKTKKQYLSSSKVNVNKEKKKDAKSKSVNKKRNVTDTNKRIPIKKEKKSENVKQTNKKLINKMNEKGKKKVKSDNKTTYLISDDVTVGTDWRDKSEWKWWFPWACMPSTHSNYIYINTNSTSISEKSDVIPKVQKRFIITKYQDESVIHTQETRLPNFHYVNKIDGRDHFRYIIRKEIERHEKICESNWRDKIEWKWWFPWACMPSTHSNYVYINTNSTSVTAKVEENGANTDICTQEDVWIKAVSVERKIYDHYKYLFNKKHFSKFIHKVNKHTTIEEQIYSCDRRIRQVCLQLNASLKIKYNHLQGLDEEYFFMYKQDIFKIKSVLQHINDTIVLNESYPEYFMHLPFYCKIVFIYKVFKTKFSLYAEWIQNKFDINITLRDCIEIPFFHENLSNFEKDNLRESYFCKIPQPFNLHMKEMIGLFTQCIKHYEREDKWKKHFVHHILKRECGDLFYFWCTPTNGVWGDGDLVNMMNSLDIHFSDRVPLLFNDIFDNFSTVKNKELLHLFSEVIICENMVENTYYDYMLKEVDDPKGNISQLSHTDIPCKHCKGKTVFSHEKQTRSCDEPMTRYLICVKCGKTTKC